MEKVMLGDYVETLKGFAFKSAWFEDVGVPVVKVTNFTDDSVSMQGIERLSEELAQKYIRYELFKDDVVIQTVGSWPSNPASVVGKAIRVPKQAHKALLNQNAVVLRTKDALDKSFLFYLLKTEKFKNYIVGTAQGAASQASITLKAIRNFEFELPTLEEQKLVAKALKNYDDLIENNNRRIEILEAIAQKLYQEWFIHYRFPCHEQTQWQNNDQGKIPAGWEVKELGELITVRRGRTITRKKAVPEDVPVVAGGLQPAYFHNVANTTAPVITVSASGANAGYVNLYTIPVWASDCSYIDTETTPYVYYYYLLMKERQVEITRMQTGAAQPHVYPKDLMRLEVLDIPSELLDEFTEKITPMFQLMANLKTKNQNLKQQRDLLLPKLIL